MKKYWPVPLSLGLFSLLCIGTAKVFGVYNNLYCFSHSLDIHADEESIRKEAEERIRKEAEERKRLEEERQARQEERERQRQLFENR